MTSLRLKWSPTRNAITCIEFTRLIRTRALILASADGSPRCSQTAGAKSSYLTRCCSRCPARPSSITEMRSAWGTIFIWATATAAAPRCSGAPTGTLDFQGRILSSFICRSRSILNITMKPSTWRTSKRISPHCCGGCAGSSPCEKISRRSRAAPLNFFTQTMRKCWRFSAGGKTRRSWWW